MHSNRPSKWLAQSAGAMRRNSSADALSNSIISARSRMGSSLHAIIILTIMVVLFAFSMFLTPQHQHLKVEMLAHHGEQRCSTLQPQIEPGQMLETGIWCA
jgi:hypothetical protein